MDSMLQLDIGLMKFDANRLNVLVCCRYLRLRVWKARVTCSLLNSYSCVNTNYYVHKQIVICAVLLLLLLFVYVICKY